MSMIRSVFIPLPLNSPQSLEECSVKDQVQLRACSSGQGIKETNWSGEFWKVTNQIVNREKAAASKIINDPEVISSSTNRTFSPCYLPQAQRYTTKTIPCSTSRVWLSIISVILPIKPENSLELSKWVILRKPLSQRELLWLFIKNINPELSPILAKVFYPWLKEKYFPISWKMPSVFPVFKKVSVRYPLPIQRH